MCVAAALSTAPAPLAGSEATRQVGRDQDVDRLTLVRSAPGTAVIRFAAGPLTALSVGDRLGRTRAKVTEIDAGRMVLEETFTDANGRPNRAYIVFKDGERGGKRYLQRPEGTPPAAARPVTTAPQ
jgi:hypothetical protein